MHTRKNPVFLRYRGVVVRRCRSPTCDDILSEHLFYTDDNPRARATADGAFRVTELPTFVNKEATNAGYREAIREAIDKGVEPFSSE